MPPAFSAELLCRIIRPVQRDLPSGTVTFLFTDVEGSTGLLHELGPERYAEALAQHRLILRKAFNAHGGVEVDTQGDAFFVAFPTAPGAFAAAHDAKEALAEGPIRVRVGIHTGTARPTGEGYVGEDVHLGARIAAAGHGGQVLLSGATRELVDGEISDLGEHRLKDFAEQVRIFQLGRERFPPLKTVSNTNLPRPAPSFVGRERELAEVTALLREGARLVTLTGPGGAGKTRLAIEVATELLPEFRNGVFWVALAPLRDPGLVTPTIRQLLGAKNGLAEHIGEREMLLLLDNVEQIVEAAPELASLVEACPNLRLLVTSRELLRVRGELEYSVPPLADPEAVELFCARSRLEADATIAELCRSLDSLPLAIELAAARTSVLSPGQILERLWQRLDLLRGGRDAEARQATLRATIEWSYELLDADEQRLFARLSVFRGGCILEAAEVVCEADIDLLQSVVDKSLVRHAGERFWMLETIREFAEDLLDSSGEQEEIRGRHAEFFLRVAEAANLGVEAIGRGVQRYDLVLPDQHNLRAAIDWATEADVARGLQLAVALEHFWVTQDPTEGMRRFEALLERGDGVDLRLLARAWRDYGGCADIAFEPDESERAYEKSVELFRQAGDERGAVEARFRLGYVAASRGEVERARRVFEESLQRFRSLGDDIGVMQVLGDLGSLELEHGDRERGWTLCETSLEMAREVNWTWLEAYMLTALGEAAFEAERIDEGERLLKTALTVARSIGDRRRTLFLLARLAGVAAARGDVERATTLWSAAEAEHARAPAAGWPLIRDRYEAHIPGASRPPRALPLDEAVEYALTED